MRVVVLAITLVVTVSSALAAQRLTQAELRERDNQFIALFNSLVSEQVANVGGKSMTCPQLADLFQDVGRVSGSFGGKPLSTYESTDIDHVGEVAASCAEKAATLPSSSTEYYDLGLAKDGPDLRRLLEEAAKKTPLLKSSHIAALAAVEAEKQRNQQRADDERRNAQMAQRLYEASVADWRNNHQSLVAVANGETIKPPSPNDDTSTRDRREKLLSLAKSVVATSVWKQLSLDHPQFRDYLIVMDQGPIAKVGEFMACFEINSTKPNWPIKVSDGEIKFNPPLLGRVGRHDVTIKGKVGPGAKPFEWTMYLKLVDDHFYMDEVSEDGRTMRSLPATVQSSGFLLTANCSVGLATNSGLASQQSIQQSPEVKAAAQRLGIGDAFFASSLTQQEAAVRDSFAGIDKRIVDAEKELVQLSRATPTSDVDAEEKEKRRKVLEGRLVPLRQQKADLIIISAAISGAGEAVEDIDGADAKADSYFEDDEEKPPQP